MKNLAMNEETREAVSNILKSMSREIRTAIAFAKDTHDGEYYIKLIAEIIEAEAECIQKLLSKGGVNQ